MRTTTRSSWAAGMELAPSSGSVGTLVFFRRRAVDRVKLSVAEPASCFERAFLTHSGMRRAGRGPTHSNDVSLRLEWDWLSNRGPSDRAGLAAALARAAKARHGRKLQLWVSLLLSTWRVGLHITLREHLRAEIRLG